MARSYGIARRATPAEYSFALEVEQLVDPAVTLFSARQADELVAVAALKRLDASHAELKSMHTRVADRARGAGRAMGEHLLCFARSEGCRRVSRETGSTDEFTVARSLYARTGFRPCEPFGDYTASAYNTFMTIVLSPESPSPS